MTTGTKAKTEKRHRLDPEKKVLSRMTWVNFAGDIFLAVFKFLAGILGGSGAMVSDAVHSLSHVFTTLIALLGVKAGKKEADAGHPYGHDRMECLAALVLGLILLAAALSIGVSGLQTIFSGAYRTMEAPGVLAVIGAIVSILCNVIMFAYTRRGAMTIHSTAFMADAKHLLSDAWSSVGALVGIIGARIGFPVMDAAASLVICAFLLKSSYDILKDALGKMMDTSCGEEYENKLADCILAQQGVLGIDDLRTRKFGDKVYVDLDLALNGENSLREAHKAADRVHDALESEFPEIKHVMIHENPA